MARDPEETLNKILETLRSMPEHIRDQMKLAVHPPVPKEWDKLSAPQKYNRLRLEQEVKEERDEEREERRKMSLTVPDALGSVGGSASNLMGRAGLDISPITGFISDFKQFITSIGDLFSALGNQGKRPNSGTPESGGFDLSWKDSNSLNISGGAMGGYGPHPQVPNMATAGWAPGSGGAGGAYGPQTPNVATAGWAPAGPGSPHGPPSPNVATAGWGPGSGGAGGQYGPQTPNMATAMGEGPGDLDETENVENVPTVAALGDIHSSDTKLDMRAPPVMNGAAGPARPSLMGRTIGTAVSNMLRASNHPAARFTRIFI